LKAATRREAPMSKQSRRSNFQRNLTRTITLRDGSKLVTLRDAANVLLYVFGSLDMRSGALDHASRRLLLTAAESGKRSDIAAATDQIERVLSAHRLL
jgi:hypothetical protein